MTTPIRVLILEDRPSDAELILHELHRAGFDPVWQRVETEADYLSCLDTAPDVILADYTLPQFDGLRALHLLQERGLDIPFIIVSGTIGEEVAVAAMREGTADYLLKDRLARLGPAVAHALEQKRLRDEKQKAEERLRLLSSAIEQSTEGIAVSDLEGKLLFVNGAFAAMHSYTPEELVGKHLSIFYTPEQMPSVEAANRQLQETGEFSGEIWHVRRDGAVFPTLMHNSFFRDETVNPIGMIGTLHDITERKRAGAEILRQLETLNALYAGAQKLSRSLDLQELAQDVVRTCVEVYDASLAWLVRAEPDGRVRLMTHFPTESDYARQITVRWDQSPEGQGLMDQAIRTGFPAVVHDIASDPNFGPWREEWLAEGFCTVAAFPLMSRGRTIGVMALYSDQPGFFNLDRVEFFQGYFHLVPGALENARLLEEANRRLERMEALREIDKAITASLDLRVTFNVILDQVTSQLRVDAADILLFNPHTQTLKYADGRGLRSLALRHTNLRLGEGYAGQAALERRIVNIPNLEEAKKGLRRAPLLPQEEFISYCAVPLIAKGQVNGVLEIFHRAPLDPDPEWMDFLETLAGQVAIAIDNATLFDDLQRSNLELTLAYDTTLEGWGKALELRDRETEGHCRNVTEMTLRLARAMGMSDAELVHIRRGALLHDIGKMGIPDSILLKPGPLTDDEWDIMRQHPVYAYQMLSPIAYLRPALDIPYCHHEKWDGSGYPRGLKGEIIPLSARIFAVVDVRDALCSDRPYRKAWPEERALAHIHEQAGKHFDPQVVETFLELVMEEQVNELTRE